MTTRLATTPSQTVGPFLHIGLVWDDGPYAVSPETPGAVWIRGRVFDGADRAIDDAMVEIWQADEDGHLAHPDDGRGVREGFRGFARSDTRGGEFAVRTVVPGSVDDRQAPHIDVSVFARGLLHRVVTRIYFPEHADRHSTDPVLATVPPQRRSTLMAERGSDGYVFDVHLQGDSETVFFDV
ncbi:protocatechuate 3,4-dioxygenase subunit alpha [Nocardia terpenica]|uniref:Protocatechuate 3,4-dioxygenase subunit alpha n=1 Tax=Nocardia terpenica TaxID=455432 RepID=A0A6G9Z3K4_9NOCA|nr:protocatechuate 3,4-dioxygenase subunit alpha [Nocardia terpenica]QIS20108.1 protocatechuate 3,4-dioxygenase subunit alpha [Nocardia terpenica]